MAVSQSSAMREAGTSRSARRRLRRRLSASHVLIAVVVILAFVLNLLVLQDRSATVLVAVADEPIAIGSPFDISLLRLEPINSSFAGLDSLLHEDNLQEFEGRVFTSAVEAGSPVTMSSLGTPGTTSGLRTMSLPVPIEHAAGGTIVHGDRVDVIAVDDAGADFVATGLEVVTVAESSGGVGTVSGYHVVVAVTATEALALSQALDNATMSLVKATGAAPLDVVEDSSDS